MKTKHTKGKWVIECDEIISSYHLRLIKMGLHSITNEENKANAKLIAAAPELLEELINLHNRLIKVDPSYQLGNGARISVDNLIKKITE